MSQKAFLCSLALLPPHGATRRSKMCNALTPKRKDLLWWCNNRCLTLRIKQKSQILESSTADNLSH